MSKIQDALHKLKADRRKPGQDSAAQSANDSLVARLSSNSTDSVPGTVDYSHDMVIDVDRNALRESGLMALEKEDKMLADEYRDIKRPLIANALGKRVAKVDDGNLIMVTSALPGEGKTFTSLNLALSIALEQDFSVLLIDADVSKQHISHTFGVSEMPGLLDLAEGPVQTPENAIVHTNVNGFSILPAGVHRENAAELLSGSRMDDVIHQLADQDSKRFIIFDTSPLLQTGESKAILGVAGQVVLVVRAESTAQGVVVEALQVLGDQKAVNLVLNQARSGDRSTGYGYGYSYGLKSVYPIASSKGSIFDS